MSRGLYRGIFTSLVDDPEFQGLMPNSKLVFYTVRLCQQAGAAAIFRYYPEMVVRQTGLTARQVECSLQELEQAIWVIREGVILWVRNGLKYDPSLSLKNPKHRASVEKALKGLPKLEIVLKFCDYYELPYPFDTHSAKGSLRPSPNPNPNPTPSNTSPVEREPVAAVDWGSPEHLVALYNRLVPEGHPKVTHLSPARRLRSKQYLSTFPDQSFWVRALSEIRHSNFLRFGSKEFPKFRGDFDWLLTKGKNGAENVVKTVEGKYRDAGESA